MAGGVLSDVYAPTIDNTNVESMRFVVTDGRSFTEVQGRDTAYTVRTDSTGMACTVTTASKAGRYTLTSTYITDPRNEAVVVRTRLTSRTPLRLYARLDASVNGNGGGGPVNGGADTGKVVGGVPVVEDTNTTTNAANRDYAVPNHLAMRADGRLIQASVGYVGTDSDSLADLDKNHALTEHDSAPDGNVVATAQLPLSRNTAPGSGHSTNQAAQTAAPGSRHNTNQGTQTPAPDSGHSTNEAAQTAAPGSGHSTDQGVWTATLALGFGRSREAAIRAAKPGRFDRTLDAYTRGWQAYDQKLKKPPEAHGAAYYLSANVIKASEDKTFPGAVVASLASPWGQAVSAADAPGGRPVYFGSYREVFSRDLYEAFTGFLTDGDLATARDTARFLLTRQQLPDGRLPRNSLLNGRAAPDTGGDQLDETAYPILMAYQAGIGHELSAQVIKAADFLVAHGPSFGVERWEEQSGYSPSTIAAEIAGLVAAARIVRGTPRERLYLATADHFARSVKGWTVTTNGPYGKRYFIRLSKNGDPNAAVTYNLGNGGPDEDQRRVLDAGFLELTRLGVLPQNDPDVRASLPIVDKVIKNGGWYRYGSDTPGTEDGYGDCHVPDPTSCRPEGKPWPTGNAGSGHVWPVLSGERAEQDLRTAGPLLDSMTRYSATGLVPEQAWEDADVPASPFGSDPATASIGFTKGQAAGSASPLTWAQAQVVRLARDIGAGRVLERPEIVRHRYARPPGALPLTASAPDNATKIAKVTGTAPAGSKVTIASAPTDTGAATSIVTTGSDGTFAADVPVGFGTNVITVTAAKGGATGYAQRTVIGDVAGGTTVLDATDPDGDDHGPGTFAYPTAADFQPGAYDLQRFQVITDATTVYLRTQLRDLTPTFGGALGAQLLDVYVREPSGDVSHAAAFPQRNYTLKDGWTQRVEVQGFAAPVWVDAAGAAKGDAAVRASQAARTITIALPKAAFGTPATGWRFAVVLHGQDGYSPDQARAFAATPQPYAFGLCTAGATSPICSTDPAKAPKAMDVLGGTDQLDPTKGPVDITSANAP